MAAVVPIAMPPQNVTRIAPAQTLAPPARAASEPIIASSASDDTATSGTKIRSGATAATSKGISAPNPKLAAE